jgi:DNA-binding transcriptional MerR regulator
MSSLPPKSPAAMRTISEVSDTLDVPQHILRFWETRFPELRPLKRGGNRRYYRPEDVALCRTLKRLLHEEGYTVKGVQKLIAERGVRGLLAAAGAPAAAAGPAPGPMAGPLPDAAGLPLASLLAVRARLAAALAAA